MPFVQILMTAASLAAAAGGAWAADRLVGRLAREPAPAAAQAVADAEAEREQERDGRLSY